MTASRLRCPAVLAFLFVFALALWPAALSATCDPAPTLPSCAKTPTTVNLWDCWEGPDLVSTRAYQNAYRDVKLKVTFTPATGTGFDGYAFWVPPTPDVNPRFTFRTAFPKGGTWTWSTTCESPACAGDTGLAPRSGTVSVRSVYVLPGFPPMRRNGFLKVGFAAGGTSGPRVLRHANGQPFLWVGDAAWAAPMRANDQEWTSYLADRRQKGFSVLQLHIAPEWAGSCNRHLEAAFSDMDDGGDCPRVRIGAGEGPEMEPEDPLGCTEPSSSDIRPSAASLPTECFWQRLDGMIEKANAQGFVVFLSGLIEPVNRYQTLQAILEPFARWVAARYSGNFVIFSPGADDGDRGGNCWAEFDAISTRIDDIGQVIAQTAPRHLVINHFGTNEFAHENGGPSQQPDDTESSVSSTLTNAHLLLHDKGWLAAEMFQSGMPGGPNVERITGRPRLLALGLRGIGDSRFSNHLKPVLNGEAVYDYDRNDDSTLDGVDQFNRTRNRNAAYFSWFSGATGFTAGTAGVWDWGTCCANPPFPYEAPPPGSTDCASDRPSWCQYGAGWPGSRRSYAQGMAAGSSSDVQRLAKSLKGIDYWNLVVTDTNLIANQASAGNDNLNNDRKIVVARDPDTIYIYAPRNTEVQVNYSSIPTFSKTGKWRRPFVDEVDHSLTGLPVPGSSSTYKFHMDVNEDLPGTSDRLLILRKASQCQFFCYEGPQQNVLMLGATAVADSDELRIEARVEDSAGGLVGSVGLVGPAGQVDPRRPSAARSGSGFVAAWEASNAETGLSEVWAQALTALGVPLSSAFPVAATETADYSHPAVGGDGTGRLFVFYEERSLEETNVRLIGRWFSPDGEKDSDEISVATAEGSTPLAPRLACEPWASCWVLWHEGGSEGRGTKILAARIADNGALLDEKPIAVRELDEGVATSLDVWVETSGTATLVWEEFSEALVSLGVFHRHYDRNGIPLGDPQPGW